MATAAAVLVPGDNLPSSNDFFAPRINVSEVSDTVPVAGRFISAETPSGDKAARPKFIKLGSIADPRLRLVVPIPLEVSVEEEHIVVSWEDADEFAYGKSMGDAVEEFSKNIGDLYHDLNDSSVPLGAELARVRDLINKHVGVAR